MAEFFIGPITVPDVDDSGFTEGDAQNAIEAVGLVFQIAHAHSDTVPEGEVIAQSPTAGTEVAVQSTVTVTISLGSAGVSAVIQRPLRIGIGLS